MNTFEPITIPHSALARIKQLAAAGDYAGAFRAINDLTDDQTAQLYALYNLGRAGVRSFNIAVASARKQPPQVLASMLAQKSNLVTCLNKGLKRHAKGS